MNSRKLIIILVSLLFIFNIIPVVDNNNMSIVSAWYNNDWSYRKTITIDKDKVNSSLTNYPFYFYLASDANLAANAQDDADDIMFTDVNDNKLYHEIEKFDGSTGEIVAWVNVSSLSSSVDTTVYMYYGNSGVGSQQNKFSVWDANRYKGVWHLNTTSDSSRMNNTVTATNSPIQNTTGGILAGGYTFNSTDGSYLTDASVVDLSAQSVMIIEFWVKVIKFKNDGADAEGGCMFGQKDASVKRTLTLKVEEEGVDNDIAKNKYLFQSPTEYYVGGSNDDENMGNPGEWHHLSAIFHPDYVTMFADGKIVQNNSVSDGGGSVDYSDMTVDNFYIGQYQTTTWNVLDGSIDECRVLNSNMIADYFNTSFLNMNNPSAFFSLGAQSEPQEEPPADFRGDSFDDDQIGLNWTNDITCDYTYIRYDASGYPADRSSGTLIYNGTGNSYVHNNPSFLGGNIQYYRAWGYNSSTNQFSSSTSDITAYARPKVPVLNSAQLHSNGTFFLSFSEGQGADSTMVRKKSGSYPSSITDGTELCNKSGDNEYFDSTYVANDYYTLFAFDDEGKNWSRFGLNVEWGSLIINVFNETSGTAISGWNVSITDPTGDQTYNSNDNTNPKVIDVDNDLPIGDDILIYISCPGYKSHIYTMDLAIQQGYTLNAHLTPRNDSELYIILVEDEVGSRLSDAEVRIRRYINSTSGFSNVSIDTTDGNGQISVWLIPDVLYLVEISKSGYNTAYENYIPDPSYFGTSYPKVFTLEFEDIEPSPPDVEPEEIIFNGHILSNILYVNYSDGMSQTENTHMIIFEINTSTGIASSVLDVTNTSTNILTLSTSVNTSNSYQVVLHFNHSTFGHQTKTLFFGRTITPITESDKIDDMLQKIIGTTPFGWGNLLIFFLLVAGFYYTDPGGAPYLLVFLGGIFLFLNIIVGFNTTFLTVAGGVIPSLFILVGIIGMWNNSRRAGS